MTKRRVFVGAICLLVAGGIFAASFVIFSQRNSEKIAALPAIENQDATVKSLPISVFITPHHLLVEKDIDAVFKEVSEKNGDQIVDRIILLSPNHFNIGKSWVIGSEKNWETPDGTIQADKVSLDNLRNLAYVSDDIFEREHGIRNLLPFVKKYFPRATLVPLALREGFPAEKADALTARLTQLSDSHTLLIVSADFSHYLDWNFSRFHDEKTLETISQLDDSHVDALDIDCVSCVRIAMKYAEFRSTPNFQLLNRTSSLELTGKNLVGEETSHLTGYFASQISAQAEKKDSVQLLFSGQASPEKMTDNARRIFMGQDKNIFQENSQIKMNVFAALSFSSKNNEPAFEDGKPFSVQTINEKKVAFVDANMVSFDLESVLQSIAQSKLQSDIVVVLWKKNEPLQEKNESNLKAQKFVDGGADLVVGTGGGPIAPIEIYKNKLIAPSLGDVSPACFSSGKSCAGIIFAAGFSSNKIEFVFMPVGMEKNGRISLATGQAREAIFEKLSQQLTAVNLKEEALGGSLSLDLGK